MKILKQVVAGAVVAAMIITAGVQLSNAAEGLKAPAEKIVIKGKKPARFNHSIHIEMGLNCARCHHDGDHKPLTAEAIGVLPNADQLKCVNCHNSKFANKKLRKLKTIFHARCRDCHKEGYNGKKGPTKCNSCHVKKKAIEGC